METPQHIVCYSALAAAIVYSIYHYIISNKEMYATFKRSGGRVDIGFKDGKDFYVYNYYKVPISVYVELPSPPRSKKSEVLIVENIEPGERKGVKFDAVAKNIRAGSVILTKYKNNVIAKASMVIPENTTIRALHCGMVSASSDTSISSLGVHSPLGPTALPRLRIVNLLTKPLRLTTDGSNEIIIPSAKSFLYYGQYQNGIPLGTIFKDIDGILPDFRATNPYITDVYLGITSDISAAFFRGYKIGNTYFDSQGIDYYPLENEKNSQRHRGIDIDKSYIPKNW